MNGELILTDKMQFTNDDRNNYHTWKKSNGLTDEQILQKEKSLVDVLMVKPLQWYLDILKECGFKDIEVIHKHFMYNTIRCFK